jgi:pyruvate dehydrogenase E2 component (dihydrolipoamide acetyltransferase)
VIDGKIEIRPMTTLSLTYDHRIVDGAPAAEFLRKIRNKLEELGA